MRAAQVGFLVLAKNAEHGSFCIALGFNYAVPKPETRNQLVDSASRL